jgi:CheY-like chemotaxis protein
MFMTQYTRGGSSTTISVGENPGIPASSDKPYVLIIDDDPAITSILLYMLEMEGFAGLSITDSLRVLPFLQHIEEVETKYFPAVILLDLMMPQLSGYELAAQLTQHPSYAHIPIIIMTADYRVRTVSAVPGAVDLLSKPFPFKVLLSKVKRYLTPMPCV